MRWAGRIYSPATTTPGLLAAGVCLLSRGVVPREAGSIKQMLDRKVRLYLFVAGPSGDGA